LDDEELAVLGIALRAVRQLGGQTLVVAPALARELARLAGRLTSLSRAHTLVRDLARSGRIFLERLRPSLVYGLLDQALDDGVAELGLRLPLELRSGQAHRHDGAQSLAHVVTGHAALEVLEEAIVLRVRGELSGQRGAEAGEMRAALARVDVVGEREDA